MNAHRQFVVPHLILVATIDVHVVEYLVRGSNLYVDRTTCRCTVVEPVWSILSVGAGFIVQPSAMIAARTDIAHLCRQSIALVIVFYGLEHGSVTAHVLVEFLMSIVGMTFIYRIDLRAVDTLPYSERRQLFGVRGSPRQLLSVESMYACMACKARQGIGETEAVGQHYVMTAVDTKLPLVELPCQKHAVEHRLCRRHHAGIGGIDGTSRHVPPAVTDIVLQLQVAVRVVFLHPHVLDSTLVVESQVRIFVEQREILLHGILNVFANSGPYIPVPLRVKMRV